jgi:endoglucanase
VTSETRVHSHLTRRRFVLWCSVASSLGALSACRATAPGPTPSGTSPTALPPSPTSVPPTTAPVPAASEPPPPTATAPPLPSPTATIRPDATPTIAQAATETPPTAPSATATEKASAKLNYLRTDGAKIRDAFGDEVTLTGLNWFGMETETLAPHGLWVRNYGDMLDQVVQAGYNCLRLPFSSVLFDPKLKPNGIDFSKNPDLRGLSGLQIMDTIVVAAGKRGLKIILDRHRPNSSSQSKLWYTNAMPESTWIAQWTALAERYRGNDAVIGADLHNEPAGSATWGSGDRSTDWAIAAEKCGNAILEINPNWLIFVEGVERLLDASGRVIDWTWQGGELMGARTRPIRLNVAHRLVYSPHEYGPSVYNQPWFSDPKFPDNLPALWEKRWAYLVKDGIAPVLVGEFGGRSVGSDTEGKWQRAFVSYMKENRIYYTYWCLNPNSSDTGGLLEDDWRTINPAKQELLKTYQGAPLKNLAPDIVNLSAVPPMPT